MTDQHDDIADLATRDLERAHESLYYAARRYAAITEESFLQAASGILRHDPSFVHIGDAAADLAEAGQRYTEAYARWGACGLPPREDEDD